MLNKIDESQSAANSLVKKTLQNKWRKKRELSVEETEGVAGLEYRPTGCCCWGLSVCQHTSGANYVLGERARISAR